MWERIARARGVLAVVLAALGVAALYYSQWLPYTWRPGEDDTIVVAGVALWSPGMIAIITALLLQPPGRTRPYARAALLVLVAASVLIWVFEVGYGFPSGLAWWR